MKKVFLDSDFSVSDFFSKFPKTQVIFRVWSSFLSLDYIYSDPPLSYPPKKAVFDEHYITYD